MKKILFCDNSLRDLLNFRGDVINSYATEGCDVILVAPKTCEYEGAKNIQYIPVEMNRSGMNPFKELVYMWNLFRIYKQEKPDYIFHYTIKPNIYGSLAARLCGIPSTAMVAGLGYVFNNRGIGNVVARRLFRFALRFPQHIFVLNAFNKALMLEKRIARPEQIIFLEGGEGINLSYYQI